MGRAGMWNPLHDGHSAPAAGRRPRWLCVGALALTVGLFTLGFLFGRGARPADAEPTRARPCAPRGGLRGGGRRGGAPGS